ncbi:hypothetical protein AD950_00380 [Gluconobacter oxydans]|nr:hypothetical protein AD950_00380 [Gluconobacter oxydans]
MFRCLLKQIKGFVTAIYCLFSFLADFKHFNGMLNFLVFIFFLKISNFLLICRNQQIKQFPNFCREFFTNTAFVLF